MAKIVNFVQKNKKTLDEMLSELQKNNDIDDETQSVETVQAKSGIEALREFFINVSPMKAKLEKLHEMPSREGYDLISQVAQEQRLMDELLGMYKKHDANEPYMSTEPEPYGNVLLGKEGSCANDSGDLYN